MKISEYVIGNLIAPSIIYGNLKQSQFLIIE